MRIRCAPQEDVQINHVAVDEAQREVDLDEGIIQQASTGAVYVPKAALYDDVLQQHAALFALPLANVV